MTDSVVKKYTANLCHQIAGEFIPYESIELSASTDAEALQEADKWMAANAELVGEDIWLITKEGSRSIRPKKIR